MKRFIVAALLLATPAFATPTSTPTPGVVTGTGTNVSLVAPEGDIGVLVRAAMESARSGSNDNLDKAIRLGERSVEALPFLEPYSHDNNGTVRFAVVMIVEEAHSRRALRLLSNLLDGSDVDQHVLTALAVYSRTELAQWGGQALHRRLLRVARRTEGELNLEAPSTLALLLAFPDARTKSLLGMLSRKTASSSPNSDFTLPMAPLPFVANLMLAELGDHNARTRLWAELARNHTNERVWLCQMTPFIQSRTLLLMMPLLLDDARPVKRNAMYVMTTKGCIEQDEPPTRLCDVAHAALEAKMIGQSRWGWMGRAKPAELQATQTHFTQWLNS